jgi:fermentation-respiration switch protein FrsA (DUF1100 family)
VKVLLLVAVAAYLALAALVWLRQESMMFFPQPAVPRPVAPAGWRIEEVVHTARDGASLAGILLLPPGPPAPLVIYFGGNAEEATSFAFQAPRAYGARAALLMNYRGYGRSTGKPGEAALVSDALELHDAMARRTDIDARRIALHGRSLGTGVAVQLAAARPARCIVLTSPFASAREVAAAAFPWLPVSLLMRHPFDSAVHAPNLRMPALVLAGDADRIVPARHSERLASLWGGPVERVTSAGFGHNDLDQDPRYAAAIRAFLDRCL